MDRPEEGDRIEIGDQMIVEGWAWSPDGPPRVTVTVGDRSLDVRPAVWRRDVSAALGIGELRGYVAMGSLAGMMPGPADVVVTATAADGVPIEVRRAVELAPGAGRRRGRPRPWTGSPERLDPKVDPGGLVHVEHVARYRWVAQLAQARDVLDAGCGVGFGAHILHAAGARSVTGIDAFAAAIVQAREQGRDGLEFKIGDLRNLPLDAARFDLAVCFEAIEHVAEQEQVLDEIKRVMRPDALLAVSTPVPGAVAVHNPHHVAELAADELERLLRSRFANVALRPQHSALASLIDVGPSGGRPASPSPPLRWTTGPIDALYVVALASDAALPEPQPVGALAAGYDVGAIISHSYELMDRLAETRARAAAYKARAERAETSYQVLEQRHAEAVEAARTVRSSRSWELTAPLRAGAAAWRSAAERWRR